ncbi:MAG: hypothetical protein EZS28_010082 [Streblomastix strix]|uniref:Uncharacterized protein n=1 Tax=Streblomastix strix TaxID=222440 RepID=A0A5J4WJD1_9EUKA|nr:MAG: hypothetical protein EZS28_010082 [Streblomastix strix]
MILTIDTGLPASTPIYINQRGTNLNTQYPDTKLVTNYVLNAGSSTSFAGVTCGAVQINPNGNNFIEGIRISCSTNSDYSGIYLVCDPLSNTGTLSNQRSILTNPIGALRIAVGEQFNQDNQGLMISADGNTLTFN